MFESERCNKQRKVSQDCLGEEIHQVQDQELSHGVNNELYISELKKILGHRWQPEQKQWSFPLDRESAKKIMKIFEN